MTPSVRRCQTTDVDDWARLRHALWPRGNVGDYVVEIAAALADDVLRGYLAIDASGAAVGFAEISFRRYANGATASPVPFLEGIWIAAEHRRARLGAALIERISADLLAEGFHELCSDAEIANQQSHRAHEGWGFAETERVVYFRKPLP